MSIITRHLENCDTSKWLLVSQCISKSVSDPQSLWQQQPWSVPKRGHTVQCCMLKDSHQSFLMPYFANTHTHTHNPYKTLMSLNTLPLNSITLKQTYSNKTFPANKEIYIHTNSSKWPTYIQSTSGVGL